MFVSESFLVGSAADNKAIIIEKTPEQLDVYDPQKKYIVCANHFQGKDLANSKSNREQIRESASDYRYKRVMELLDTNRHQYSTKNIDLLRDTRGLHNSDIGLGNEKAINQLIAHHSIVFEPKKLLVWVSTSPWQLGPYIAYDLHKIFALQGMQENKEICEAQLNIPADSFMRTTDYKNFILFRSYKQRIADGGSISVDSLVMSNPAFYHTYVIAGDYLYKQKRFADALPYYKTALAKIIATKREEDHIKLRIAACIKKTVPE